MRPLRIVLVVSLAVLACVALAAPPTVVVLPLTGAIGPATADFVTRGMARADRDGVELIVLQIDTPGGLDTSMREIIKAILASRVPVASFVAPSGARAASAGTYILYASHVAAMAPGTNLGAATPIQIGAPPAPSPGPPASDKAKAGEAHSEDTLTKKQVHDAAAYIRGFAQMRGRNAEWAERAVREAVSLSADEALAQHVIDVTARDVAELETKLEGRKLTTAGGERVLHTAGAETVTEEPDWKNRLLAVITNPSIALILMMLGAYGLFFEFSNPGLVLPGVVGAIALLLGLFALHMLPVNFAGVALIALGIGFLIAEAFLPTYGSLAVGGIIAFAIGALMLIDTEEPGFGIPVWLVATIAAVTAAFVLVVAGIALKARRRPVVTGSEELIGSVGVMLEDAGNEGWARVRSEQWRVHSAAPLKRGQAVRVTGRDGLILTVSPLETATKGVGS